MILVIQRIGLEECLAKTIIHLHWAK